MFLSFYRVLGPGEGPSRSFRILVQVQSCGKMHGQRGPSLSSKQCPLGALGHAIIFSLTQTQEKLPWLNKVPNLLMRLIPKDTVF